MDMELMQTIDRVRRAMPRNGDVMAVCNACEALMLCKPVVVRVPVEPAKPKLSRAQIQKNYRARKKRLSREDRLAAQKAKTEEMG